MKKTFITALLIIVAFSSPLIAAGSIRVFGSYEGNKLVTLVNHEDLKASSTWKFGDGEPPITPIQAADLAIKAQKIQFPEFKRATIREISLRSTENGCYYAVQIVENVEKEEVTEAGGAMKVNQMSYIVMLNSKVITPTPLPPKEDK